MKNITSITSYNICLTLLFSILSFNVSSQENGIFELSSNTTTPTSESKTRTFNLRVSKSSKSSIDYRGEFNNLAYKLHPTVYVENGMEKTYGNGTIIKMTLEDANSISALGRLSSKYSNTKLLTINLNSVNDLNRTIDLNSISNFSNLKYIFLKCRFSCNEALLNQFINRNSSIRVYYLCAESE